MVIRWQVKYQSFLALPRVRAGIEVLSGNNLRGVSTLDAQMGSGGQWFAGLRLSASSKSDKDTVTNGAAGTGQAASATGVGGHQFPQIFDRQRLV